MVYRLKSSDNGFISELKKATCRKNVADAIHVNKVAEIIANIKNRGDDALIEYTAKLDNEGVKPLSLELSQEEIRAAATNCKTPILEALKSAAVRIENFHKKQAPQPDLDYIDDSGTRLGMRWAPLQSVGIYVPGGTAAYPSSVLMNAIPAKIAGVKRISMVVPTPNGYLNPDVMAAAEIAGINEIYRIGGAQAIAALTYGTETILPIDKIVGPGNKWVAEAKRQVFGDVGIDMVAGPSEILIVADNLNNCDWIAADLLSQAEHDKEAQSILITDDSNFANEVSNAVDKRLNTLPRRDIAYSSWHNNGLIIIVKTLDESPKLINLIAPEHLELAISNPEDLFRNVLHAGSVFLGRYTPEAIGDYVAGPNHVLPTSNSARFSSGLAVYDFLKRTTFTECNAISLSKLAPTAITIAKAEGLTAHAISMQLRTKGDIN